MRQVSFEIKYFSQEYSHTSL